MQAVVVMLSLIPLVCGADTEPGKLGEKLTVKDVQGGFAGFTGSVVMVEKNGIWAEATQGPRESRTSAKGRLTDRAMAKLAEAVKKYGAATLKNTGKPVANPRVVTITYGKHVAVLNLRTTAALPAPDEKDMAGRFAGIVKALRAILPPAKK